jgi:transposase
MAKQIIYKAYHQHQLTLLPYSLEELIPGGHPVRIVNSVIDQIDISSIEKKYKTLGCPSFHPRMLLKVMVYSYLENVYSSRGMERLLKENINYMWLSGNSKPDHNTINRFRAEKLRDSLETVFGHVVELMIAQGVVSLKQVFTDGTKIEANANRYSFVWGKSISKSKERIGVQLKELWAYTQKVAREEFNEPEPPDFEPTDPAKIKETVEKIQRALKASPEASTQMKQKANYAKRNWPSKLEQYAQQEEQLQQRNSMSKTDPDATFMRMKEDHMQNGQLKPGYNLQISTNNQYIVCYSLHQQSNDFNTLAPHLHRFEKIHSTLPEDVVADAGYGSEENYKMLEGKGINAYVKYPLFDKEMKSRLKDFDTATLHYNAAIDCYYCPMGQAMENIANYIESSTQKNISIYQAKNCHRCPLNGVCHKSKGQRTIKISHELQRHRQKAKTLLTSEKGEQLRKKRSIDVEPTFGHIKHNKKFKRFNLRGLNKVNIEIGLIAIAQNLKKMAA